MGTKTSAPANFPGQPIVPYTAGQAVELVESYVNTDTPSDGDVLVFSTLKIPFGTVITDLRITSKTPDGKAIYTAGFSGAGTIFGSATADVAQSTKAFSPTALPYTVTGSDDAATRYKTLQLTQNGAATSGTTSTSIALMVRYILKPTGI